MPIFSDFNEYCYIIHVERGLLKGKSNQLYNDTKFGLLSTNLCIWELTSIKDKLVFVASLLCQMPGDPGLSQCILSFQIKSSCSEPDKDDLSSWKKHDFIFIF